MKKLLRSSVASAAAAWAWKNRSTIISKVRSLAGKDKDSASTPSAGAADRDPTRSAESPASTVGAGQQV